MTTTTMENPQLRTLKPSKTHFVFPPHRRRHLKSHTFRTLVPLFSHCYHQSQSQFSAQIAPADPKQDDVSIELRQVIGCADSAVANQVGSKNTIFDKESLLEDIGSQNVGFSNMQMEVDEFGRTTEGMSEGSELVCENNSMLVNSLTSANQTANVTSLTMNNEVTHDSIPTFQVGEIESAQRQGVDDGFPRCETSDLVDFSLDMDLIAKSLNEETAVEGTVLEDVGRELCLKEMELEKLIYASDAIDSSVCATTEGDLEEGEILGSVGIYDKSMDSLLKDSLSLEDKSVDQMQITDNIIDEEVSIENEQSRGHEKNAELTSLFVGMVDNVCGMEVKARKSGRYKMEENSKTAGGGGSLEAIKADWNSDPGLDTGGEGPGRNDSVGLAASLENVTRHGNISEDPGTGNQGISTENHVTKLIEQDAGVHGKKKREKRKLTEKRREKKKRKKNIKRAEKNRRLGVNRMKLPPTSKPKTVALCRHYVSGRCQQGGNCKFSHDTIPLTKSVPCCHFARHSCMKGDDCPYDHQLSKYPCNNYKSKGYCSRGSDCMFSHEMPAKEGQSIALNNLKPDGKSVYLPSNNKQLKVPETSNQNLDVKSFSPGMSNGNSSKQNVAEIKLKPASQAPEGMSFLLHKSSLPKDTVEHKCAGSSDKVDDGVRIGHQMNVLDAVQNSNEIIKRKSESSSLGINFLSFGKAPTDEFSNKKSSSSSLLSEHGIGKSPLSDFISGKQVGPSGNNNVVEITNQSGQPNSAQSLVTPLGINFFSFANANEKEACVQSNKNGGVASCILEKPNAPVKVNLQNPWSSPFSSLPCHRSLDELHNEHGKSTPNFVQKSILPNTPSSGQRALLSTLAFAAKFESGIKINPSVITEKASALKIFSKDAGSLENSLKNS